MTNPLLGPLGATSVYGPQKGVATAEQHQLLEDGLTNLSALWIRDLASPCDIAVTPGGGAAGGLGAGLMAFCRAKLRSGVELVAAQVKLADAIRGADLVITGEGRIGTNACIRLPLQSRTFLLHSMYRFDQFCFFLSTFLQTARRAPARFPQGSLSWLCSIMFRALRSPVQ